MVSAKVAQHPASIAGADPDGAWTRTDGIPDEYEEAADFLARLRVAVAAGRPLPVDVGQWAVEQIAEHLPSTARRMARDRHLRTAASFVSGSAWAKARRLRAEILAARRGTSYKFVRHGISAKFARNGRGDLVALHVREAVRLDPVTPTSLRQLLRLVG